MQKNLKISKDAYGDTKLAPQSVILDSVAKIQQRVAAAEKRIANGEGISNEEYEVLINRFFREELGIAR